MSVNYRGWRWIDEDGTSEHSEAVRLEVERLSLAWSELHHAQEQRGFERQAAFEDGDYGPEPEPCDRCGGLGQLGIEPPRVTRHGASWPNWCGEHSCPNARIGITCPECGGDGFDRSPEREAEIRLESERLQIESVEAALLHHGARMMRPYEHWNEDEAYMQYQEEGRFGHCSS